MLYVIYEYIYMYTYTNFMLTNRAQQNKIKFFIHENVCPISLITNTMGLVVEIA